MSQPLSQHRQMGISEVGPTSETNGNPFDKMFEGEDEDSSDDEWWEEDDDEKPSLGSSEAPAPAPLRTTQWPRAMELGGGDGAHSKPIPRSSTRRVSKRYSVVKPTRDKSKGRQRKQNAKAGIKLITNFTKQQASAPGPSRERGEAPAGPRAGQFVDLATLQALNEDSRKATPGFWKSRNKTEAGNSSKEPEPHDPTLLSATDPSQPTAERRGRHIPSPLNIGGSLSPNDRAIPIGICIPSASLSKHSISPQTATSEQSGALNRLPTNDLPETPTIIITPAQEQSTWSPFGDHYAVAAQKPRATSSFYSQATPGEIFWSSSDAPPVPKMPQSAFQNDAQRAVALKSCFSPDTDDGTTFDENEYDERSPRRRIVSGATIFEEDESPILVRSGRATSISLGSKAAKHASISTVGTRRQSKGWWNYITTPFNLTRSNTINDTDLEPQQPPALPSLAIAAEKAREAARNNPWEKTFSPITPETTTTTIASDVWWSPVSPKKNDIQAHSPQETRAVDGHGHKAQESTSSGTLPFFLAGGALADAVLGNPPIDTSTAQGDVDHNASQAEITPAGGYRHNDTEQSVSRDTHNNNPFVQPAISISNPISTPPPESGVPALQSTMANGVRAPAPPASVTSDISPPPYSPPKALVPRYRAVFPPGHPLGLQYPASPGPISPGLQQVLAPPGGIQMSEVPEPVPNVSPAASVRRPINLNSGYPALPARGIGSVTEQLQKEAKQAQKAEAKRRRHEKEEALARRLGGWWRGRGCIPEKGCYGRTGAEGRKRRRIYLGLLTAFLLIIILILVLVMKLHRKSNSTQQSQWLNLTGFPPIFTGLSTVAAPVNIESVTACTVPSTVWSCALPKELQSSVAPNQPDQPNFLLYIQWDNSSAANESFANVIGNKELPSRSLTETPLSAREFIGDILIKARQAVTFTPSPAAPSIAEQEFLGNTTDGIVSDQKAGEATPFYISFLSTANSSSLPKRELLQRQPSGTSDPFPNVTDLLPPPSTNSDGTAAAANLLPYPSQQPIRLYDRGLPTEHYGFYTYFDRSIFLKTEAALNNSATTDGVIPDDENGGSTESEAVARCTWAQTRFLVQMWTRMNTTAQLLNGTTSRAGTSKRAIIQRSTPITFIQPGSFPYPITITLDRHGGDPSQKSVYCYGMNDREEIIPNTGTFRLENRAAGGTLINPAPSLFTNNSDPVLGGYDGGTGGCICRWSNFVPVN